MKNTNRLEYMIYTIIILTVITVAIHTYSINVTQNEIKTINSKIKLIEKYNLFYNVDSISNKK